MKIFLSVVWVALVGLPCFAADGSQSAGDAYLNAVSFRLAELQEQAFETASGILVQKHCPAEYSRFQGSLGKLSFAYLISTESSWTLGLLKGCDKRWIIDTTSQLFNNEIAERALKITLHMETYVRFKLSYVPSKISDREEIPEIFKKSDELLESLIQTQMEPKKILDQIELPYVPTGATITSPSGDQFHSN